MGLAGSSPSFRLPLIAILGISMASGEAEARRDGGEVVAATLWPCKVDRRSEDTDTRTWTSNLSPQAQTRRTTFMR